MLNKQIKDVAKDWDIDAMLRAVVKDDPEMKEHQESLRQALLEVQRGRFARKSVVNVSLITQLRHKVGLSQSKFAQYLGISVNTLKSWEQGQRNPSGAALKLIQLLDKYPELVMELG
ncbi:type II toxin-antitoxin system MqsA family antitoxin [Pelistega sp. NLN82]|uniref:Type II toxin-antitoxin system MqsA family antitoxin n=1 Tax=Pelistega ratti TaxID=2652177 RepID=A0A6L9Y746_9BURK|nr:type II toxin-antitoxin system MqsA family antitoxin [Pelistega ratti]NEN76156.1 type II toxin-antitoxin system MqsA family antitoxin [Pelistega ratti]